MVGRRSFPVWDGWFSGEFAVSFRFAYLIGWDSHRGASNLAITCQEFQFPFFTNQKPFVKPIPQTKKANLVFFGCSHKLSHWLQETFWKMVPFFSCEQWPVHPAYFAVCTGSKTTQLYRDSEWFWFIIRNYKDPVMNQSGWLMECYVIMSGFCCRCSLVWDICKPAFLKEYRNIPRNHTV